MDEQEDPREPAVSAADSAAGEAAFQVLEMLLLTLVDKGVIEPDALIAEIESLAAATPGIRRRPSASTLRGHLGGLAISLSAYAKKNE